MKAPVWIAAAAVLLLSACVTTPTGVSTPSGPASIPSGAIELGDWRRASAQATMQSFERTIASRYGAGLQLSAVTADLRRNDFSCSTPGAGRGDPPAQVCRRTMTAEGCTHTWQAHLFDAGGNGLLARTRGLYDRRSGGDGLLGGPGK